MFAVTIRCRVGPAGLEAMRIGATFILCAGLMAVSTAATAFQEQSGGTAAVAPQAAPAADKAAQPAAQFSAPDAAGTGAVGTEVRIPGLGKLGVLPKMDFGLELLYGAAADSKPQDARPDATSDEGDLRIRGTVKHRF